VQDFAPQHGMSICQVGAPVELIPEQRRNCKKLLGQPAVEQTS